MKCVITALVLTGFMPVGAQLPSSDQLATNKGPLFIKPVRHASMVVSWDNKIICTDPTGEAVKYGTAAPDLVLVTDIHGDHFDPKTLAALNQGKTVLVMPQAVADLLPDGFSRDRVRVMRNGERIAVGGMSIEAIPMYNLPEAPDARHIKGRGNGYVLTLGKKRIYFSGDTGDIVEMRALKDIDVAFVCMNMPYTMDINQASSAVLEFKPKVVYPYHHRGQDIAEFKKLVNVKNKNIDVRLLEWYPGQ